MLNLLRDFYSLLDKQITKKVYLLYCVVIFNGFFEIASLYMVYAAFSYTDDAPISKVVALFPLENIDVQAFLIMSACLVYVFKVQASFWVNRFIYATSIAIRESLQVRMISKLLAVELDYVSKKQHSYWTQAVTLDAYALEGRLITPLFVIFAEFAVLVTVGLYLLVLNPIVFMGITLLLGTVSTVLFMINNPKLVLAGQRQQANEKRLVQLVNEVLAGWREIRVEQVGGFFERRSSDYLSSISKNNFQALSLSLVPKAVLESVVFLLIFVFTGIYFLLEFAERPENVLAMITVYGLSAYRLLPSVSKLIAHLQSLKHATSPLQTYMNELRDVDY